MEKNPIVEANIPKLQKGYKDSPNEEKVVAERRMFLALVIQ